MSGLDEIVDTVIARALDESLSIADAAAKVLTEATLDPADAHVAAVQGVARLAHVRLHHDRAGAADCRFESDTPTGRARSSRFQLRTDHMSEGAGAYFHLSKPFAAADGALRPLLAFTVEDWSAARSRAAQAEAGHRTMRRFFAAGLAEVRKRKAPTTAALPKSALRDLERHAGEIFEARSRPVAV